jgi:hypothetical protein
MSSNFVVLRGSPLLSKIYSEFFAEGSRENSGAALFFFFWMAYDEVAIRCHTGRLIKRGMQNF